MKLFPEPAPSKRDFDRAIDAVQAENARTRRMLDHHRAACRPPEHALAELRALIADFRHDMRILVWMSTLLLVLTVILAIGIFTR